MKISVVTPSFNQAVFLEQTARSVLTQSGPFDLEWIVIDGGSSDGTVELLKSIDDARLRWISEPDEGQSDAVNKGLALATGDVIGWINSDDLYEPGALAIVMETFTRLPSAQWLIGRCRIVDESGCEVRRWITAYKEYHLHRYSRTSLLRRNFISQMSVFWRRPFGQAIGPLDPALHYVMDYDLWLRMAARCDPVVVDRVLASFRVYPQSKSGSNARAMFTEQYRVAQSYLAGKPLARIVHRFNIERAVWIYRLIEYFRSAACDRP